MWIIVFLVLHFILERVLFLISFSAGMNQFDTGRKSTILENLIDGAIAVLQFPIMTIALVILPTDLLPGISGYVILLLNSVVWGIIFWVGLRKLTLSSSKV